MRLHLSAAVAVIAFTLMGPPLARAQTPDVLASLGRNVIAVLGLGADPHLLLVEEEGDDVGYRMLGVGDVYRAGWVITAIAPGEVTLQKAARTRTVAIEGPPPPAQAPSAPIRRGPSGPPAKFSLTNSMVGGTPPELRPAPFDPSTNPDPAQFDYQPEAQ